MREKVVTSFSAFLTYLMNQKFEFTLLKDHNPMLEKVKIVSNTIILKDNIKNRVVELKIKKGKIFCEFDKKTDCIHLTNQVLRILSMYSWVNHMNMQEEMDISYLRKFPQMYLILHSP